MSTTKTKPFAQGTKVDPMKTLMEITALLEKAGATEYGMFKSTAREGVTFAREGISYRITVYVPVSDEDARQFLRKGSDAARLAGHKDYRTAERARRLRALLAVVRAKVIAVDDEIYSFEEAFGFDAITDTGETVAERMVPQIKRAAIEGNYPSALPMPGERGDLSS